MTCNRCMFVAVTLALMSAAPVAPTKAPSATPAGSATPALPSVALFNLEAKGAVQAAVAEQLTDLVLDEMRKEKRFSRVVSQKEVETVLGFERQKQMLDCSAESCVSEIAGSLGVDLVVTGSIGRLGSSWVFSVRMLRSRDGQAASSVTARACGESEDSAVALVVPAVAKLLLDAGVTKGAVPPFPSAECAGVKTADGSVVPQTPGALPLAPEPVPEEKSPGRVGRVLRVVGGVVLAAGLPGLPVMLGLLGGGAGVLAAFYRVPELRAAWQQDADGNFALSHVPSAVMAGAGAGVLLLGTLMVLTGAVALVAGVIL